MPVVVFFSSSVSFIDSCEFHVASRALGLLGLTRQEFTHIYTHTRVTDTHFRCALINTTGYARGWHN